MDRKQTRNQYGFTLIEVMIAMVVFSVGLLGVATMQINAIGGNSFASGLTEAATIAQDKMEELMALDYDDPLLDDTDGDGTGQDANNDGVDDGGMGQDNDNDGLVDDGEDFGLDDRVNPDGTQLYLLGINNYTIFWNVAIDEPETDSKRVRVIIAWIDEGLITKEIVLNSIKVRM